MKKGFVIDSLPRTGSTTLARLLGCHPDIKCLIEPFHPRRYNGQYHRMAVHAKSVNPVLNLISHRWNGIKHVWVGPTGFPFPENPELNDGIVLAASHVIFLERRNHLRRYLSSMISRQVDFWIGTRGEFRARLENVQLRELDPALVLEEITRDKLATEQRLKLFGVRNLRLMHIVYEDFLGDGVSHSSQFDTLNQILNFLGFSQISEEEFEKKYKPWLDRDRYQWSSADVYRMVPGIENLERAIGSADVGWLF